MGTVFTTKDHFSGGFNLMEWNMDFLDGGRRDKRDVGDLLTEGLYDEAFLEIGFARTELDKEKFEVIYEGPCHFAFGFMDDVLGGGEPFSAPFWKISFDEIAAAVIEQRDPEGAAIIAAELRALADKIDPA